MNIVVYKLGGSLLLLPDLAERLEALLSRRHDSRPLLIVGGGAAADVVRRWDELHGLNEERAHWLALRAMMLNESLVATLLPRACMVRSRDEAEQAWDAERLPILCAHEFLKSEECSLAGSKGADDGPAALPHHWDVTSDSIAAWVALRWPAAGLTLLKSRSLAERDEAAEPDAARCELASHGSKPAVDPYFSTLAPRLPRIEWINLRAEALIVETGSTDIPVCANLNGPPVVRQPSLL